MYQGIEKMQLQAQEAVYLTSITADIANYVRICLLSARHKATQLVQPMLPWDIPNSLWQEITTNYFNHKGKDYLLICDLLSKYPFLIQKTQELIAQYRASRSLHTDNRSLFCRKNLSNSYDASSSSTSPLAPTTTGPMVSLSGRSRCSRPPSAPSKMPELPSKTYSSNCNQHLSVPVCLLQGRFSATGPYIVLVSPQPQSTWNRSDIISFWRSHCRSTILTTPTMSNPFHS